MQLKIGRTIIVIVQTKQIQLKTNLIKQRKPIKAGSLPPKPSVGALDQPDQLDKVLVL